MGRRGSGVVAVVAGARCGTRTMGRTDMTGAASTRSWNGAGWASGTSPHAIGTAVSYRAELSAPIGPLRASFWRRGGHQRPHGSRRSPPRALVQPVGEGPTGTPLNRTLLAFRGEPAEDAACLAYQREPFVSGDGDGGGARTVSVRGGEPRRRFLREQYMREWIERIAELLAHHQPAFLVCYGTTRRREFARIVGGRSTPTASICPAERCARSRCTRRRAFGRRRRNLDRTRLGASQAGGRVMLTALLASHPQWPSVDSASYIRCRCAADSGSCPSVGITRSTSSIGSIVSDALMASPWEIV